MAQRRPTPRASPRGKVAAKKAPATKKATALAKKVPAAARKALAAAKKVVPSKKRAATKTPATKAPAAKRAATAKKVAHGPKSASPQGEKLARAVQAAAGQLPGTPESPGGASAEPATPPASARGKRAKAVKALPPKEDALADASAPMGRPVVDTGSNVLPASEPSQAESASPLEPAPAPKRGKGAARKAEPEASAGEVSAPAEPTRLSGPPAEPQYLVLTGGSPFLRAIGYIQRAGGEPLPGFSDLTVTKLASSPLPTDPGTYEFRFRVRNGTGDFKLAQRNEKGATKNAHSYEVDPKDASQTWRFTIP